MNTADSITCFVTDRGIDVVLRINNEPMRTTVPYETLTSVIGKGTIAVKFDDKRDDVLSALLLEENDKRGRILFRGELRLQPAGHFFSFLRPLEKATPISLAEARARAAAGKAA